MVLQYCAILKNNELYILSGWIVWYVNSFPNIAVKNKKNKYTIP